MAGVSGRSPARPSTTGGGNLTATYLLQTPDATLPNAQALSALATGMVANTNGTGVLTIATLSGLSFAAGVLGNNLITGKLGGQTLIGGTASANNLTVRSNTLGDGQVFWGNMTNPSYWVDSPTASGVDCWMFKTGKPSAGLRQAATFCSRGNAIGDNVSVGFGAVGYGVTDGGASVSPTRIECVYVASLNQNLRFFTTVANVGTEFLTLDGLNSTVNLYQTVTLASGKNISFATSGTGSIIGATSGDKFAFWGKPPVAQQARPTDAASIIITGTTIGIWA